MFADSMGVSREVRRPSSHLTTDEVIVMCGHDDRRTAAADVVEESHDVSTGLWVEIAGRLIG